MKKSYLSPMVNLGTVLKNKRLELNLTTSDVSERTDLSLREIFDIENAEDIYPITNLIIYAS